MTEIAYSIDLDLVRKLRDDPPYRQRFFWAETSARIAADLIALRKRRGLNQKQVAEKIGTKQPAISRVEKADYQNWNLNTLRTIADALDARVRVSIEPYEDVLADYNGETEQAADTNSDRIAVFDLVEAYPRASSPFSFAFDQDEALALISASSGAGRTTWVSGALNGIGSDGGVWLEQGTPAALFSPAIPANFGGYYLNAWATGWLPATPGESDPERASLIEQVDKLKKLVAEKDKELADLRAQISRSHPRHVWGARLTFNPQRPLSSWQHGIETIE